MMSALHQNETHIALGQAGTGKTETAKDFAVKTGHSVIVCNTSDQIDVAGLKQLLKG